MGKIAVLVWKNFRSPLRHPLRYVAILLSPILFSAGLWLTRWQSEVTWSGDCDFISANLAPSHPFHLLSSFLCHTHRYHCARHPHYRTARETGRVLTGEERPPPPDANSSLICPGISNEEVRGQLFRLLLFTCAPREEDVSVRRLHPIDLIFRGHLLYHPNTNGTREVMDILGKHLDAVLELEPLAALSALAWDEVGMINVNGLSINATALSSELGLLGSLTACYSKLGSRSLGLPDAESALREARAMDVTRNVTWAVIHFTDLANDTMEYSLTLESNTRRRFSSLFLQSLVDAAIIQYRTGDDRKVNLEQKTMPQGCRKDRGIYVVAKMGYSLLIGLGLAAMSYYLVVDLTREKADGLWEFLLISGVGRLEMKLSWLLFALPFFLALSTALAFLVKYAIPNLIEFTGLGLILFFCILYGLASLSFSFALASLLSSPSQAMGVYMGTLILAMNLPGWAELVPEVGYQGWEVALVRLGVALHPTFAALIAVHYVAAWEEQSQGATWDGLFLSPDAEDMVGGVGELLVILGVQIPAFLLLSAYLDLVLPGRHGIRRPFYAPFRGPVCRPKPRVNRLPPPQRLPGPRPPRQPRHPPPLLRPLPWPRLPAQAQG